MNVRRWWSRRGNRRAAEIERAAREQDAAEAEAARQRVLELARRQRPDPEDPDAAQALPAWNAPTFIHGLPLLTYGQRRQYRTGPC